MATITLKNIPDDLYLELKNAAHLHRRSINNEVIFCIENTIKSTKINPDKFIEQLDRFYEDLDVPFLTEETLKKCKEEGRE